MNLEPPKCNANTNRCDGISNFEPGMTLGQNSWVFIVIGTATPSIRNGWGCLKNHPQKLISNKSYCQKILKMSLFKGCIMVLCYEEFIDVAFLIFGA